MPCRLSLLIDYNSAPTNLTDAAAHKGGWSESVWVSGDNVNIAAIRELANLRANLLPKTCRVIGYRTQVYTLVGGHFRAGGSSTGDLGYSGNPSYDCDLPQVSLSIKAKGAGTPNNRRFSLRGIPDDQMKFGEYQPTSAFKGNLTRFLRSLTDGTWSFPARDLTLATYGVMSVVNGVLVTDIDSAFAAGEWVRFLRVKDENGAPVQGVWRINAITNNNNYGLQGFDHSIIVGQSGRVRKDSFTMVTIANADVGRAGVKKIGSPFEKYRGRSSKRRAA